MCFHFDAAFGLRVRGKIQANMLLSNITISPYHDLLSHNVFAQLLSDAGPNITLKN